MIVITPEIQLILGTFTLSLAITYAWWTRLRVWGVRQDLFDIRDEMWDRMRARGTLDHPDHLQWREILNTTIRIVPLYSIPFCARARGLEFCHGLTLNAAVTLPFFVEIHRARP